MYLNTHLNKPATSSPLQEHLSLEYVEYATGIQQDQIQGYFKHLSLSSHFQAIYSFAHQRAIGYEALLRAKDQTNRSISPLDVFARATTERDTIFLDRLSRDIHVRNFSHLADDKSWLFLNIDPLVTVTRSQYGIFFKDLLQSYQIPAHRTVVEILERRISDESLLMDAAQFYKQLGCLVAIDDFGAGHSNFDRIWRLEPEIVKLDRSIIVQASETHKIRRVLPKLVSLIHESGSLSLIEGIETEEQALIAMDSGANFVQGYYFAKPQANISDPADLQALIPQLSNKLKDLSEDKSKHYLHALKPQIKLLSKTANLIENNMIAARACLILLQQDFVKRCYLLDHQGKQVGPTLTSSQFRRPPDPRMKPLQDAEDAIWSQRSYFQQAIKHFAEVQISNPYLSIADANICITLSVSFYFRDQIRVLCCDLGWNQLQQKIL